MTTEIVLDVCVLDAAGNGIRSCSDILKMVARNCRNKLMVDRKCELVAHYIAAVSNPGIALLMRDLIPVGKVKKSKAKPVSSSAVTATQSLLIGLASYGKSRTLVTNTTTRKRLLRLRKAGVIPGNFTIVTPKEVLPQLAQK